jgi:hypothetical protein
MRKRRTLAAGGIVLAITAIAVVAFASTSPSSSGSIGRGQLGYGQSLSRIRVRNLQLQSMLVLLTERQSHSYRKPPVRVAAPSHRQAPPSVPVVGESSELASEESACDPNYEGASLDPNASDYDCEGGSGNGPDYTGEVTVVGEDHFGLDADGDGIGCEEE